MAVLARGYHQARHNFKVFEQRFAFEIKLRHHVIADGITEVDLWIKQTVGLAIINTAFEIPVDLLNHIAASYRPPPIAEFAINMVDAALGDEPQRWCERAIDMPHTEVAIQSTLFQSRNTPWALPLPIAALSLACVHRSRSRC